jgi:limonene 1,2-monooxygenase
MHIAETKEQAYRDVEHGIADWFHYFQKVAAFPQNAVQGDTVAEMIEFMNSSGAGVIGTPEDACRQVERLQRQSGGFGAMLLQAHDWADDAATAKSYKLIQQHVAPHFQGSPSTHAQATLEAEQLSGKRRESDFAAHEQAISRAQQRYAAELSAK